MKTQSRYARSVRHILASAVVVAMAASTQGQAPSDTDPATRVSKKLPKQQATAVQAPMVRTRLAPAGVDREFLLFDAAVTETDPADLPVRTVEVLDDATLARGGSRGLPVAQAPVYLLTDSCLFGHYSQADYTFEYGTWAAQARFDCPPGYPLCSEKGWQPGDQITGYEVKHFYVSSASANAASVEVELWDGDPRGAMDTVCNPTPAPIAGTKTTFTGLARATHHFLRAHLPAPVTYNCDRVWIVVTMIEGCRAAWTFGGTYTGSSSSCQNHPPDIGWGGGYINFWGCQQYGRCPPYPASTGWYGTGTCCTDGSVCDYWPRCTGEPLACDGGPNDGLACTDAWDCWVGDCGGGCHSTYCSAGVVDYYFGYSDEAPAYYNAQPGAVYAATDMYIALVPVSADAPPDQNPTPDGWQISGNEIILANPGRPVWLELRISDWDPDHTGSWAKTFHAKIDSSGYSSGLDGPLTPYAPSCTTDADCEALMGSLGHPWGCAKGGCGVNGVPQGLCAAGFIDNSRSDYLLANMSESCAVDLTTLDYRYGGTTTPFESPHIGDMYAGTLVLAVPANAKGTFIIDFDYRWSYLKVEPGIPMPMLGFIPAKITVGGSVIDPLVAKNRYLSFVVGTAGKETALRVTFKDLPAPYDTWNDTSMWVGPPVEYCENSGQATPPAQGCGPAPGHWPTYWASTLQCDPHYRYWSTLGVVYVFHEGVIPGATYEIQSIETGHDISVEDNFSAPVEIRTSIWGDIVRDCTTYPCGPPDGSVDITTDVTAVLDKFRNLGPPAIPIAAVAKARADIEPQTPDQLINITDVSQVLNAFRGFGYPFSPGPPPCGR